LFLQLPGNVDLVQAFRDEGIVGCTGLPDERHRGWTWGGHGGLFLSC